MSPYRALKPCSKPGCGSLVKVGVKYCPTHHISLEKEYPRRHPEQQKLYNAEWRKLRVMHLAAHPLCVHFDECHNVATVCHHKIDHKGDYTLFMDTNNLESLCRDCHNKKTGERYIFGKGGDKKY